jgi:hypothetical protein
MLTTLASAAVTAIATSATVVVPANLPRVIIDRTIPPVMAPRTIGTDRASWAGADQDTGVHDP